MPHLPRLTWPSNLQRISYLCDCRASMEGADSLGQSTVSLPQAGTVLTWHICSEPGRDWCFCLSGRGLSQLHSCENTSNSPQQIGKRDTRERKPRMAWGSLVCGTEHHLWGVSVWLCQWLALSLSLSESRFLFLRLSWWGSPRGAGVGKCTRYKQVHTKSEPFQGIGAGCSHWDRRGADTWRPWSRFPSPTRFSSEFVRSTCVPTEGQI